MASTEFDAKFTYLDGFLHVLCFNQAVGFLQSALDPLLSLGQPRLEHLQLGLQTANTESTTAGTPSAPPANGKQTNIA